MEIEACSCLNCVHSYHYRGSDITYCDVDQVRVDDTTTVCGAYEKE